MAYQRFQLFNKLGGHVKKPSEEELREKVRELQDENNQLVSRKWELELQIASNDPNINTEELRHRLKNVEQQIDRGNYQEQLKELLTKIRDMEIERTGHSKINSGSPYTI